jgi:hypothetical protein
MNLPVIVENSKIPVLLSKFVPFDVFALSFGIFIFCRSKITDKTWRHEMIHYRQQKELWFVGQWALYAFYFFQNLIKYKDGEKAYRENPFEREAYTNDLNPLYLIKRKKFAWKGYRG